MNKDSSIEALPKRYKSRPARKFNKFVKLFAKNPLVNPVDIAAEVYDCKNRDSASAIAGQNLAKLGTTMSEVFNRCKYYDLDLAVKSIELTRAKRTIFSQAEGTITDKREVEAFDIQLKALELIAKLKGLMPIKKNQMNKGVVDTHLDSIGRIGETTGGAERRPIGELMRKFTEEYGTKYRKAIF